LKTAARVKRAFDSLEKKRLIEEGKIADGFLAEWVKTVIP
jgi:hypothetical protein